MQSEEFEFTTSRRVRAADFKSKWLIERAEELFEPVKYHRKLWEYAAICQVYKERIHYERVYYLQDPATLDIVSPAHVLGFGVGREPLPAWFSAQKSANVIATDKSSTTSNKDWIKTKQHADGFMQLTRLPNTVESEFSERVLYQSVDMSRIPDDLLRGEFDFTWSCSSFEHIGGIEKGLDFFCNQMKCLRPGGVAVHTTEFDCSYELGSPSPALDTVNLCLFRITDLRRLEERLRLQGDLLVALDPYVDKLHPADLFIDREPYTHSPYHLNIAIGEYVTTSIILIAIRGGVK